MILFSLVVTLVVQTEPLVGRASVVDGDTLDIRGERVRLWGIDAFERGQRCDRDGRAYRCGTEAANQLDRWIAGRTVRCTPRGRPDRYGRIVASCRVNGQDAAAWMVSEGWALDHPRYSGGAYGDEERRARTARRGAWGGVFERPWAWRDR
ncbi:MAG: thermonuclease family protein [Brevundimonas sp.]